MRDDQLASLLSEMDEWATVPGAGAILASRLLAFVRRVVPVIDRAADALVPQLEAAGVDDVASANPSTLEEFAALLAAQRRGGIHRLLLQHGDHLMPYEGWMVTELQNFDTMWTSDATVPADLARAAARYSQPLPAIRLRSPRVEQLTATRPNRRVSRHTQMAIGYVPAMLVGDSYVMGGGYFDDAWYHRWHLQLLDWMASRKDRHFVWKALPASDQAIDPVPEVVRRLSITNVTYETRSFSAVAPHLAQVFLDFPSTALYESVHLRLPVLAVVFSRFVEVRRPALERFGGAVQECDDEEAAFVHLDRFLDHPLGAKLVDPNHLLTGGPIVGVPAST